MHLVRNRHRVVSKDELLDRVWNGHAVTEGSLQRAISILRSILRDDAGDIIRTYNRRGYRFCAEVREIGSMPPETKGGA